MSRRPVTLVLPYYENPGMLAAQYRALAELPEDVRKCLNLIVVDDGSPESPAVDVPRPIQFPGLDEKEVATFLGIATFQLFRVDVDVRWNWLTCRNIGVQHSKAEWVLLTDVDHTVPEATWRRITERKLNPDRVYRFSRADAPDLTAYKPHPNTWLMTREMFNKIGGYDERFSGFYGTDGEFRDRVRANADEIVMLDEVVIRHPREVIADASTTKYGRKEKQDHEGVTRVRAQIAREQGPTRRLSFPYHQVV